jgi:hypothetical protein
MRHYHDCYVQIPKLPLTILVLEIELRDLWARRAIHRSVHNSDERLACSVRL